MTGAGSFRYNNPDHVGEQNLDVKEDNDNDDGEILATSLDQRMLMTHYEKH